MRVGMIDFHVADFDFFRFEKPVISSGALPCANPVHLNLQPEANAESANRYSPRSSASHGDE